MTIDRLDSQSLQFPTEIRKPRPVPGPGPDGVGQTDGVGFTQSLGRAISEVNEMQQESAQKIEAFVRGEDVPLHEVVLAQEEAEISFRLMLEVRDRLVRAYQEILRTPM